jgi:trans-aconitate methyltransferase
MIAYAQRTFPRDRFPRLQFQCEDARRLSFRDMFDVVFSNAALHWVLDHRSVLEGIAIALTRGGRTLLQMGGRGNAADVITAAEHLRISNAWREYFSNFTSPYGFYGPEEYREWLKDAGLNAARVELLPKDMVYERREDFEAWIRTTWLPYIERVPDEERESFISALAASYLDNVPPGTDGRIHVRMARLEVEAVKP